jgi:predicted Rossmann fold flavoprotein
MPLEADVIVLGAGAAGLMCAIEAGKRGRRVLVLEHNGRPGRKILISGGGRCNFTNLHTRPEDFLSRNPHFAKSALARYTPRDFLALVERHGIPWHEKTAGQLICDRAAQDIVSMLEVECAAAGVRIETSRRVRGMTSSPPLTVETDRGALSCESVVVATGGLSIPKAGATDFGYKLARSAGLEIVPCRPALTPLLFNGDDRAAYGGLTGASTEATVAAGGACFRGKILFTHRGLSGPAVLQASSYWTPGEEMRIDLAPGFDFAATLRERRAAGDRSEARTLASQFLPKRLADTWFEIHGGSKPAVALGDRDIEAIAAELHCWRIRPAGLEGYEKAEVTAGGVDTAEISSKTFEARKAPGLYFIGEVLDVTGRLGGFNFQWAWASGFAAGQYV